MDGTSFVASDGSHDQSPHSKLVERYVESINPVRGYSARAGDGRAVESQRFSVNIDHIRDEA